MRSLSMLRLAARAPRRSGPVTSTLGLMMKRTTPTKTAATSPPVRSKTATRSKPWESYEAVSQHLLNELASKLHLLRVEGKQTVHGALPWEILISKMVQPS